MGKVRKQADEMVNVLIGIEIKSWLRKNKSINYSAFVRSCTKALQKKGLKFFEDNVFEYE